MRWNVSPPVTPLAGAHSDHIPQEHPGGAIATGTSTYNNTAQGISLHEEHQYSYTKNSAERNSQLVTTAMLMTLAWIVLMFLALGRLSAQQLNISQVSDLTTPLGTPVSVQLVVTDLSPNSVSLLGLSDNQSLVSDNNIVIALGGSTRQLTITPTPGQSGTTTLTIIGTNAAGQNTSMSFRITVGGTNFGPTISSIAPATTPANVPLTAFFTITDASPGTVSVSASADNSVLVAPSGLSVGGFGSSRNVVISPNAGQFGSTVITLVATNQSGFSARTSFTLTVSQPAPAQAPTMTAVPDLATAVGVSVSAFFNVFDQTGAQNVNVFASTSNTDLLPAGSITITGAASSRQITLRPAPNVKGRTVVFLQALNPSGLRASSAFTLYVAAPNDPPVVEGLRDTVLPQNTPVTIPFKVFDANPNALIFTPTSANPDIVPNANVSIGGSGINRTLTFTPAQNRFGEVAINVGVRNQNNVLTFGLLRAVFVAPPRVGQIPPLTTPQNTPVRTTFTLEDINTSTLQFSFSSSNPGLIPTSNIAVSAQGTQGRSLTITPAPNQIGTATITMTVTNQNGLSTTISFPVTVFQSLTPPSISAIGAVSTARNVPVSTMFTVGDADITSLRFSFSSSNPNVFPANNVMVSGSGTTRVLTLTPAPNQVGVSQITVTVTNSSGLSASTNFVATVVPPPSAPTLRAIVNLTTPRNTPVSLQFVASDENLASLFVSAVSSNQALFPNSNLALFGSGTLRTITMTPAFNQLGVATITITAVNLQGQIATLDFTVTVTPPLLPPIIAPIGNITIGQNQIATRQLSVSDPFDVNSLRFAFESSNPTLQPTSRLQVTGGGTARTLTVAPAFNQSGTSDVILTVTNQQGLSANTSFRLTVIPPPTASEFFPPNLITRPEISTSSEITVNDGSGLPLTFSIQSSNENLVPISNVRVENFGNNRYRIIATPVAGLTGRARITVTISNGFATTVRVLDVEVIAPVVIPTIQTIPFLIAPPNGSTGLQANSIRFLWSQVPGAFLYHVQVASDTLFELIYLNNEQLTDTTWNVTEFGVERQYFWRVRARFGLNNGGWSETWTFRTGRVRPGGLLTNGELLGSTTQSSNMSSQPAVTRLLANVPNPFSDATRIEYELAEETPIHLEITDALGRRIAELANTIQPKGAYSIDFQAKGMASGVYWCVLHTPREVFRQKMVIQK